MQNIFSLDALLFVLGADLDFFFFGLFFRRFFLAEFEQWCFPDFLYGRIHIRNTRQFHYQALAIADPAHAHHRLTDAKLIHPTFNNIAQAGHTFFFVRITDMGNIGFIGQAGATLKIKTKAHLQLPRQAAHVNIRTFRHVNKNRQNGNNQDYYGGQPYFSTLCHTFSPKTK